MQEDIQKSIEAGKLTSTAGSSLGRLSPGTYVMHKSWGFGKIASVDFITHQMTIDFGTKKAHPMQLQYAAESLTPVAADHILAQKHADPAGIKAKAKSDPVALMRVILTSFGGKATQEQIASVLVRDVMSEAEFKKWIEGAKRAIRADGHFAIPTKKGQPFELREGQISHADEYLAAFESARQVKHQIDALDLIVKHIAEFKDPVAQLQPLIIATNNTARKSAKLHTSQALTLLLTRDELIEKTEGLTRGDADATVAGMLIEEQRNLPALLSDIPAAKMRRAVLELPKAFGDQWPEKAISLALRGKARVVTEAARLLLENGKGEELRAAFSRAISEHSISSEALQWVCNERGGALKELADIHLLSAIFSALERDQFNEKKDRRLHDLLLNDQELVPDLIANAGREELRDTVRKLLLTPVFEELNKRSILGRIIRQYPELQSLITGDAPEKDEALIVSWESLEKRKAELDELVNKKIPENVKEISIARDYGDLRENFEFKAAKEMQRVLSRRRSETERDLALARGTDFSNVDTSQVSIGTVATVRDVATGETLVYSILGAWDTDPDAGIISYKSALAMALIGAKEGDQVKAPTEHGDRVLEILKIEAYRKPANAAAATAQPA